MGVLMLQSKFAQVVVLFTAVCFSLSSLAESKNKSKRSSATVFEVGKTTGRPYLEYYARVCDDKSWTKIKTWAKRNAFEKQEFAPYQLRVEGKRITSPTKKYELEFLADKLVLKAKGAEFKGSLCDVVVAIIEKTETKKSALIELLLPTANAEELETEPKTWREIAGQIMTYATLGAGVGGVIGAAVAGPPGALVGGGVAGGIGLLFGVTMALVDNSRRENEMRIERLIAEVVQRGTIQSCTLGTVQIVSDNTEAVVLITKRPASVRLTSSGNGGTSGRLPNSSTFARGLANAYGNCKNARDVVALNNAMQDEIDRLNRRLAAQDGVDQSQNGSVR